jgi:hypothetical protein
VPVADAGVTDAVSWTVWPSAIDELLAESTVVVVAFMIWLRLAEAPL